MLAARTSSGDSGTKSPGRRRSSSGGVLSAEAQPRRVLTWSRHRTALEEESAAATASSGVWGALLDADGAPRAALRGDCASVGSASTSDLCVRGGGFVSEKHLSLLRVRSAHSVCAQFGAILRAHCSARDSPTAPRGCAGLRARLLVRIVHNVVVSCCMLDAIVVFFIAVVIGFVMVVVSSLMLLLLFALSSHIYS